MIFKNYFDMVEKCLGILEGQYNGASEVKSDNSEAVRDEYDAASEDDYRNIASMLDFVTGINMEEGEFERIIRDILVIDVDDGIELSIQKCSYVENKYVGKFSKSPKRKLQDVNYTLITNNDI